MNETGNERHALSKMIPLTANSTMSVVDLGAGDGAHKRWIRMQSQRLLP